MNRTFKILFNRARGTMMVANEATRSVSKGTTKAVVAVAVASALSLGTACAEDFAYSYKGSDSKAYVGYSSTSVESPKLQLNESDTLTMTITGKGTRAHGLLADGVGSVYTNYGTINTNVASSETASPFWQTKAMMANNGGKAVNEGTINITNAYGMTVGTGGTGNTVINNGNISVDGGAAMEIAPTGLEGTVEGTMAIGENNGTITVNSGTGIVLSGKNSSFTNSGQILADANVAILLQKESETKSASGITVTLASGSETRGAIYVDKNVENSTINFEAGSIIDGRIIVNNSQGRNTIEGTINISNQSYDDVAGAAIYFGDTSGVVNISDSNFIGNTAIANNDWTLGGAVHAYGSWNQNGGSFVNNTVKSVGATGYDAAGGGAFMVKGTNATFTNVEFSDNKAIAEQTETGYAYGGAIMVDYSTGNTTGVANDAELTIVATKDMVYSDNTVASSATGTYFDTYGYHLPYSTAGGFLFLDRGSDAVFNVEEGATLTIGSSVTNDDTDSIGSSIPNTNTVVNNGKHASISKMGSGHLLINSSLNKYYGTVDVQAGQMTVNSNWDVKNAVTVDEGATLTLGSFKLVDAENSGNQDVTGAAIGGSLTVAGTLQTSSGQVFTSALNEAGTTASAGELIYGEDKLNISGTLALTDALYNLDYAQSAGALVQSGKVIMLGDLINAGEIDNELTLDEVENVGENVELNNVTISSEDQNIQIGGTKQSEVAYRENSLAVGALSLGTADTVTVTGGKTLSLAGNGGDIIASSDAQSTTVTVTDGATLALGGAAAKGGTISGTVNIDATSSMSVSGDADFTVDTVKGDGTVLVGNDQQAGTLVVNSLEGMTGMIFIDPDWIDVNNTIENASAFVVNNSDETLNAYVVAARNSVGISGASRDEAVSAFNKLASAHNLSWKDDVTAAFYAGSTLDLGTTGSILVDGSLADSTQVPARANQTVTVAEKGMFIVNQPTADEAVVTGNVQINDGGYLGVVNAKQGTFTLATGEVTSSGEVVTDNPFLQGTIDGNKVTNSLDTASGSAALASTGIQAMTRRADMVFAQTIADRTSIDQELGKGLNLWVDVSGETYEADSFDNGGEFEADMGYGAFGADIALTDTWTVGGALQYGTGSLRSDVSSIKNDIKNYGVGFYASKSFGAAKVVGEVAYIAGENDISASQSALNQDVDTTMYSAGLRAQYQLTAGQFQFVPSIGVRVSRLETDAMNIGSVEIDDQDQTLVQVPIALSINGYNQNVQGWSMAPCFRIAYVPTFGDKEIDVLGYDQDVIDTNPVQMDFGVRAGKDNMMFNAHMTMGAGEHGSSSIGAKLGMKYVF